MNSREKATAEIVSRLMRGARKNAGLTQVDVARRLRISQGSLSKMESSQLIPSITQWFDFCELAGIAPQSFQSGYIDRSHRIKLIDGEKAGSFKLPERFSLNKGSAVRSLMPLLSFLYSQRGSAKTNHYLKRLRVDPDFFVTMDNQINFEFGLEVARELLHHGDLRASNLEALTRLSQKPELHGDLHPIYDKARSSQQLLRAWVDKASYYDADFKYRIEQDKEREMAITIEPEEHLAETSYRNDPVLGNFVCLYRKGYLTHFSQYGGHKGVELDETDCSLRGGSKCVYKARLR